MDIIFGKPKNCIALEDITDNHIVVAIISKRPCILRKESENHSYKFNVLYNQFVKGNFVGSAFVEKKHTILQFSKNAKFQVFEEKDWKLAL